MATEPVENYEWAESAAGDRVVEPASLEAGGWLEEQAPPSTAFNWIQRMIGRWIGYFRKDIADGRDPEVGYKYDPECEFFWDFNPADGQWVEITSAGLQAVGGVTLEDAANPPYIHITVSGGPNVFVRIPWKYRYAANTSKPNEDAAVLTSINARCKGTGAGSSILVIRLYSVTLQGTAARVLEHTFTPTLTAGFSTQVDSGLSISIEDAKLYYFEIEMNSSGGGTPTDTGLAALYCGVSKPRVE